MIELSIVLLILSLLVGSLLVGRQIVDRAKIQRYLFELDYYEKNFHMFYDTYRTVVGHLSAKTCRKYSKFNTLGCNLCNQLGNIQPSKLMESDTNGTAYIKYTSEYKVEFAEIGTQQSTESICSCSPGCGSRLTGAEPNYNPFSEPWLDYGWIVSSYDKYILVRFSGFNFKKQIQKFGGYNYNIFATSNKRYNTKMPHELDNAIYRSSLDMHNTVYFDTSRNNTRGGHDGIANNDTIRDVASLSSKMASELDAKIDDGRPGSGKILALKGGHAHNANTTNEEHKAVCYDKMANEVDKAIYHTSTDIKYGCNIIKVMEDVK